MGVSGGETYSDMQLARQRAADPSGHRGGRGNKLMWLIATGVGLALVGGLVAFFVIEPPEDRQRARSQAAAEQLAGWVRQAGFEPTQIEGDLGPDQLDVGGRTVEIGDATQRKGRAHAWFDCGPTSVHVLVDMPFAVDVEDLPPDGGHDAVREIATGLVAAVPCPVDHPAEPAD